MLKQLLKTAQSVSSNPTLKNKSIVFGIRTLVWENKSFAAKLPRDHERKINIVFQSMVVPEEHKLEYLKGRDPTVETIPEDMAYWNAYWLNHKPKNKILALHGYRVVLLPKAAFICGEAMTAFMRR